MPSVEMSHARTSERGAAEAAEALCNQLGSAVPKLVVIFASRDYDHVALNKELRARMPKTTRLLGASTNGEIDRDGMHEGTVVMSALWGDFEVGLGLGRELSLDAPRAGDQAIRAAARELGARPDELGSKRYVAAVLDDGYQFKKEELLLGVMSMNQALVAVGGGASDKYLESGPDAKALVHIDGEVTNDAVAIALFRTDAPWAALRSHWYTPTGKTLRITKVDSSAKRALEIDGKPAAKRYAEVLGVDVPDLEFTKPEGFATYPTALRVGREYFIRSPWMALEDNSIVFANMLEEGSELEIVKTGDIIESTRRFFETELPARVHNPRASLLFHCSGRKVYALTRGKMDELSKVFSAAPPCIGFNVHFETYCGFHINSTLTSLTFGAS
jgi:hypothetical protein